jgi:hypothetical protein
MDKRVLQPRGIETKPEVNQERRSTMSTCEGSRRPSQLSRFNLQRNVVAVLALFLALTLLPAVAPPSAYGQAVPQVLGKTMGEWTAAWNQWLLPIPASSSPLLDTTGQFAAINQKGPVWFLVGTFVDLPPVTRTVTVPAGKHILFPIVNVVWVWFPGDADTVEFIRTYLLDTINPYGSNIPCTLDGVPTVFNHRTPTVRTQSPPFPVNNIPADNLFGVPIPAGSIGYSDGFWVMLPPLAPGAHVLKFGASPEITYNLTVRP